jgi:diguanylate cyclase (GGDEF)-like protein
MEGFARLSGLTVKCVGADGNLVGKSAEERNLCRLIRGSERGLARCRSHCGRKIAEAIKEGKPEIFRCYAGLHCFCVPIRLQGRVVGVVFGGKILTDAPVVSRYVKMADEFQLDHGKMFKAIGELRIGKVHELEEAMDYLASLAQTLISPTIQTRRYGQNVSRLFTLFHLGNDLNLVRDSHELYGLIVNSLCILFDLKGCSLMLLDSSETRLQTASYYGPESWDLATFSADIEKGIVARVFGEHKAVCTHDRFQIAKTGLNEEITKVYTFPLHFGQKVGGIINVYNSDLSDDEIQMIRAFCDLSVMAIQNVDLRKNLHNRIIEISNIGMMTSEVGEIRELDGLFQLILNRSTEIVKAEQASLMILEESTKALSIKASKGVPGHLVRTLRLRLGEGIAGRVLESGVPMLVTDIERDQRIRQMKKMRYKTGSFISIPLVLKEHPIGVLNIADKINGEIFNEDDLKIIKIFASQAVIAMERTELYQRSEEMKQILITDHLTGLLNRRYFFERVTEEVTRAERHNNPLSLMMIDVDDFKKYNDMQGHPAGDDALRSIASLLRDTVRNIDFVARYGGEEFTVVLPQTTKQEAVVIGERLRGEVERFYIPHEEQLPLGKMTISIGLATYPEDARQVKSLIDAADKALYRAKDAGKNRMVLFKDLNGSPGKG